MKKLCALLCAAAFGSGCATNAQIDKLQNQINAMNEKQLDFEKTEGKLLSRLEKAERDIRGFEYRVQSLGAKVEALQPPKAAIVDPDRILGELERDGSLTGAVKAQLEQFVKDLPALTPEKSLDEANRIGMKHTLPWLAKLIRQQDNPARANAIHIMTHCNPSEIVPVLEGSLSDGMFRTEVLKIFSQIQPCEELRKALEKHKDDGTDAWKIQMAEALMKAKSKVGVQMCIGYLFSGDSTQRTIAIDALKRMTGFDLGYKPHYDKADIKLYGEKWEAWWKENEGSFVFPER